MKLLRKISLLSVSVFLTFLTSGVATGQNVTPPAAGSERIPDVSPTNPDQLPTDDTHTFLRQLHAINMAEIKAGEAAMSKSANEDIRSYATMLITSHQALDRDVSELAGLQKVDLKVEVASREYVDLSKSLNETTDALGKADAKNFDQQFIDAMIETHDAAITIAEAATTDLRVVSARQLAGEALATFRDHKMRAEQLKNKLMTH